MTERRDTAMRDFVGEAKVASTARHDAPPSRLVGSSLRESARPVPTTGMGEVISP